jgi:hypothetical protein
MDTDVAVMLNVKKSVLNIVRFEDLTALFLKVHISSGM